ncbi:MAG: L,D-transpeptidase [Eubacterium sp.]|nr:L,D-transpeptidase [Eubacterium sp.]
MAAKKSRKKKKMRGARKALAVMMVMIAVIGAAAGGMYIWQREEVKAEEQRLAELEAQQRAAEEAARAAEEAARKAEEERIAAEEEAKRKAAEEEARRKAEEEARKKAEEEAAAEAARKAEEELLNAHPELRSSIIYTLPTGDVTLDRDVLITWLIDNGDGTYTRDEDTWYTKARQYVAKMAETVNTRNKDRIFHTTGLGEIILNTGSYYGWEIDEEAETNKLLSELDAGTVMTREPIYISKEVAKKDNNNGIGKDYCEVDLSRQHLWIYRGGQPVFETDVVSGMMDEAHYTPPGVYLLLRKETNAVLKGERLPNGTYTYEAPVSYWMPFTTQGHGLHDANWKWAFGGEEYIWNGSHGCINLPVDAAGSIFNLMTTEMPLVIYYSEYFELRPAPPSEYDQYVAALQAADDAARMEEEEERLREEEEQRLREEEERLQQEAEEAAWLAEEQAAAEQAAAEQAAAEQAAAEQAAADAAWYAEQQTYSGYDEYTEGYDYYEEYDDGYVDGYQEYDEYGNPL